MICGTLNFLAQSLNAHLKRVHSITEDIAAAAPLAEVDGTVNQSSLNKIALFLVNIEKDSLAQNGRGSGRASDSRIVQNTPPLTINLYVMAAAHFPGANYQKGLRLLSNTLSFFQRNAVFESGGLPQDVQRISVEIENLDMASLSHFWGILGGKYVPSVLYKVRALTLAKESVSSLDFAVNTPSVDASAGTLI